MGMVDWLLVLTPFAVVTLIVSLLSLVILQNRHMMAAMNPTAEHDARFHGEPPRESLPQNGKTITLSIDTINLRYVFF